MGFYTAFFDLIDNTLGTFIGNTVSNTISAINPVVYTMLLIALGWFGWSSMMGVHDMPIKQLAVKMIQWSVVISIATNTGLHSQYIVNFFWQSPDALANAIIQSTGANGSISSISFIDRLFVKFDDIANQFNQQGITFSDFGASLGNKIFAWIIWIMGGLLTMTAAFQFIMAKTALAVLIGVSPIFIILAIWTNTRKFFESWLGQVLNYMFLPMLTAAFISVVLTALDQLLPQAGGVTEQKAIEMIALTGVSLFLIVQVPSIASALGGGVAINTFDIERKMGAKARNLANNAATWGYKHTIEKPIGKAVGYSTDKLNRLRGRYNSVSKND